MNADGPISMRERLGTDYAWTRRQREVLDLISQGRTNAQIAEVLGLSLQGAKWHVTEILTKLNAESREEAAEYWRRYHGMAPRFARVFRGGLALGLPARIALAGGTLATITAIGIAAFLAVRASHESPDELRIPLKQLEVGIPQGFYPAQLGTDPFGRQVPLWLVREDDDTVRALIGKDPHSGCAVPYEGTIYSTTAGSENGTPLVHRDFLGDFKALCSGWVFTKDGEAVFGATYRGLDSYPATVDGDEVVVRFNYVVIGHCREDAPVQNPPVGCSTGSMRRTAATVPPPVIRDWGSRSGPATPTP